MFATCIFCHSTLGGNESLHAFPVGRRLAYDAAKGRLWVVCLECGRWNLSPLEERWEAIEEAERAYRGTKKRVATDNIALARLRDGTDLIRIGSPLRPEFAAWRYGSRFGTRWKKHLATSVGTTAVGLALAFGAPAVGESALFGSIILLNTLGPIRQTIDKRRPRTRIVGANGQQLIITAEDVGRATFVLQGETQTPRMEFPHLVLTETPSLLRRVGITPWGSSNLERKATLQGEPALRALSLMLPVVNRHGAYHTEVTRAVEAIEQRDGNMSRLLRDVFAGRSNNSRPVVLKRRSSGGGFRERLLDRADDLRRALDPNVMIAAQQQRALFVDDGNLTSIPTALRLALEMSLHEDDERRALQGELQELEQLWRDAETIAAIADSLTVPPEINEHVDRLRDERD